MLNFADQDSINAAISREYQPQWAVDICSKVISLAELSLNYMRGNYHPTWEKGLKSYSGEVDLTPQDKDRANQGNGEPLPIPLCYTQVQTFAAFCFTIFNQRKNLFGIEGGGPEDYLTAKLAEKLLERDLTHSVFSQKLYQILLDLARMNLGVIKHTWQEDVSFVYEKVFETDEEGNEYPVESLQERIEYQGNKLTTISPFAFLPDVRLPLTRFAEGEYCGDISYTTKASAVSLESAGFFHGLEYIKGQKEPLIANNIFADTSMSEHRLLAEKTEGLDPQIELIEMQLKLVPNDVELGDGKKLGKEKFPVCFLAVVANGNRLIRFERMNYLHNSFTYDVALFSPDQEKFLAEGLVEMIDSMQDTINWFLKSHIANVRKHVGNKMIVDPAAVEWSDVQQNLPVIRLKPMAAGQGVDKFVKQLAVSDLTQTHVAQIQELIQLTQLTTSINDNMLGQFHSGRRSATESRNVSLGSGSRLQMICKLIYDSCFVPLGKKLLKNHQAGLSQDVWLAIEGDQANPKVFELFKAPDGAVQAQVNRTVINGRYDFKLYDGTLPSEKERIAVTLQEVLVEMMKSPQGFQLVTQVLGYNPGKLFKELLELRGVKNPDKFKIRPEDPEYEQIMQRQAMEQEQQMAEAGGQPQQEQANEVPAEGVLNYLIGSMQ